MKKTILRNIAAVTAVFIIVMSIMLVTNYFQVRGTTPLQSEVIETLKLLNDRNPGNEAIQDQIRQLDLLARKAFFVRHGHLMTGIYILLGMSAVFVVCLQLYYANVKNIPEKEIDPIDEWAIKTRSRKYLIRGASGLAVAGLVFAVLSSPYLRSKSLPTESKPPETTDNAQMAEMADMLPVPPEETENDIEIVDSVSIKSDTDDTQTKDTVVLPVVSKVTHNAFRGNNSNGISSAKRVPVKWNLTDNTNIAWKRDIPRKGFNSPIINGNKVFFTGADEQVRELYCYDLTTGEKLWSLAAADISGSPAQAPKTSDDTGLAASSAATNGKQVCAIFATGDIVCADTAGKRLWAKNIGVPDNHYGYASSLLVYGNLAIVQYDNRNASKVVAFDIVTGAERWSKDRRERVTWSSPVITYVDRSPQLVLMGNPGMTAYNPNNGEQLWRVEFLSGEVGSSACGSDGIVFGASEYSKLVAVNASDGIVLWESNEFLPEVSSPVATKDNLFLATSYGVVACFDTKTGELKTSHELSTEFYSSPVIAEGKLYLFDNDGKMYVFSATSDLKLLSSFATGEATFATPAFTDGKIVVRTEKSIYCAATP